MRVLDKLSLIDKVARALQAQFTYDEIDVYLGEYQISPPSRDVGPNSKWVYSKAALKNVPLETLIKIAEEMDTRRMFFDTAAVIDPNAATRRALTCARPMSRKDGLARAWGDAGLIDIEVDSLTIRMDYASFLDFWLSIDGEDGPVAEYLATLDTETKSTLRRLIEAAYLDGEPDGPRSYAATAWAVKGRVP